MIPLFKNHRKHFNERMMIRMFIDRVLVVIGALFFMQVPNFFAHYTQRLGGHVAELRLQIDAMQKVAAQTGKTLPEFISKFQSHVDMDIALQGNVMKGMMVRFVEISNAYMGMLDATALSRPVVFLKSFQWDVVRMTWGDFAWGLSFSIEGVAYGVVGILVGTAISYLMLRPVELACKKIRK